MLSVVRKSFLKPACPLALMPSSSALVTSACQTLALLLRLKLQGLQGMLSRLLTERHSQLRSAAAGCLSLRVRKAYDCAH